MKKVCLHSFYSLKNKINQLEIALITDDFPELNGIPRIDPSNGNTTKTFITDQLNLNAIDRHTLTHLVIYCLIDPLIPSDGVTLYLGQLCVHNAQPNNHQTEPARQVNNSTAVDSLLKCGFPIIIKLC